MVPWLVRVTPSGMFKLLASGTVSYTHLDVYKRQAFQVQSLLVAYKERFDKDNFIKNLLLDNLLLVDIYNRAKKLHIDTEAKRVIFIIETSHEMCIRDSICCGERISGAV